MSENLIEVIPEGIGKLTNLFYFNLRNNNISTLPNSISELQYLEELNLALNQHFLSPPESSDKPESEAQEQELTAKFGKLTAMVKLDLTHTKISTIPKSLEAMVELKELVMAEIDGLTEITASIGACVSLEILNFRACAINAIHDHIGWLDKLIRLDLSKNQLTSTSFPSTFLGLKSLKFLVLRYVAYHFLELPLIHKKKS